MNLRGALYSAGVLSGRNMIHPHTLILNTGSFNKLRITHIIIPDLPLAQNLDIL